MAPPIEPELLQFAYLMMILFMEQHWDAIQRYHDEGHSGLPMSFGHMFLCDDDESSGSDEEVFWEDFHDGKGVQLFRPM